MIATGGGRAPISYQDHGYRQDNGEKSQERGQQILLVAGEQGFSRPDLGRRGDNQATSPSRLRRGRRKNRVGRARLAIATEPVRSTVIARRSSRIPPTDLAPIDTVLEYTSGFPNPFSRRARGTVSRLGRHAHQRSKFRRTLVAACGINRNTTQAERYMDLTAFFRGDRGHIGVEALECAGDHGHKSCPERMVRRSDRLGPAIVSAYGNNRAATQKDQPVEITAIVRGDRFRVVLRKSSENPRDSNQPRGKRKSFANLDAHQGKKPGKTLVLGGRDRFTMRVMEV